MSACGHGRELFVILYIGSIEKLKRATFTSFESNFKIENVHVT